MPLYAVARPCRTTESMLRALALAALGLVAGAAPAAAYAQDPTGGTAPEPAPESTRARSLAPPPTANLYGKPAPRIRRFACRSDCGAAGAARPGSLVRIRGRNLAPLAEVVFLGADGDADDTSVAPRRVRRRSALARVPRTAASGPIALVRADGTRSPAAARPLTIEPRPADVPAGIIDAEVQGSKVFFGARRPAELSYVVGGSRPASVQVELVRADDGAVVEQWAPGEVEPGIAQSVRWDGTVDGEVQRDGVYEFRVTATDGSGVRATSSAAQEPGALGAPGARASASLGRGARRVHVPALPLPADRRARLRRSGGQVRRRPRPPGPGRVRRVRHADRRRARRRREVQAVPVRRRQLRRDRRRADAASTSATCTCARRRS